MNSKSERSNTGYKGITYRQQKGRNPKYETQIVLRRKRGPVTKIWIGQYKTLPEALIAREEFIKSLF